MTLNHSLAQSALDGLDGVELGLMSLMPAKAPRRLDLLRYSAPTSRVAAPAAANDIAVTRTGWEADTDALLRDSDGHLHVLTMPDWFPAHQTPPLPRDPYALMRRTAAEWTRWAEGCTYDGPHADTVRRSLITLKALTYRPTDGIVAAGNAVRRP